jgi:hypothetical protein
MKLSCQFPYIPPYDLVMPPLVLPPRDAWLRGCVSSFTPHLLLKHEMCWGLFTCTALSIADCCYRGS